MKTLIKFMCPNERIAGEAAAILRNQSLKNTVLKTRRNVLCNVDVKDIGNVMKLIISCHAHVVGLLHEDIIIMLGV